MGTSTRHHRLEGGDTIPIREEGTSAAIILIAGFLRHRIGPGIGQFAPKAIIAKQHVGDAFTFSGADPRGDECGGFIQLGVDDDRTPGEQQNDALRYPTAHVRDFSRVSAAECQGAGITIAFGIRRFPNSDDPDIPFVISLRAGSDEVEFHRG